MKIFHNLYCYARLKDFTPKFSDYDNLEYYDYVLSKI